MPNPVQPGSVTAREFFVVQVVSISEDQNAATANVVRPTNVPIDTSRLTIIRDPVIWRNTRGRQEEVQTWARVQSVLGLHSGTIELDSDTAIVQLTTADVLELEETSHWRPYHAIWSPIWDLRTCAICFRTSSPSTDQEIERIVMALRLYRPGALNLRLPVQFINSLLRDMATVYEYGRPNQASTAPWEIPAEQAPELREWVNFYREIAESIEPSSVIGRALTRFERTYEGDLYDRITDAVIGLETIVAPVQAPEILYRVRQRVGFLLAEVGEERIEIAAQVKDAYDVRSGIVHAATKRGKNVDEVMAARCQELLRRGIRRILQAPDEVRIAFCRTITENVGKRQDKFYEALISFGAFEAAVKYWRAQSKANR